MDHKPFFFRSLFDSYLPPKQTVLLFALLAQSSCTHSYHFKVDAIAGGTVQTDDSYYLAANDDEENGPDVSNEEVSAYIQTALESKGFQKAPDLDSADTLIVFTFGVGDPVEIWVTESGNSANLLKSPTYTIRRDRDSIGGVEGTSTHLAEVPNFGSESSRDRLVPKTVFEKFLKLEAYDNRLDASTGKRERLWSIGIANADPSDDIREYLPYMLAVSLPYIAEETGEQISVELEANDPMIKVIHSSYKFRE